MIDNRPPRRSKAEQRAHNKKLAELAALANANPDHIDLSRLTTEETIYALRGSLLLFTRTFYQLMQKHEYVISRPVSQESHYITMSKLLTKAFYHDGNRFLIALPPRYGKSVMLNCFVAWCFASYPDCEFIYISYTKAVASMQTQAIREIMVHPEYRRLFGVELRKDSTAKAEFITTANGRVYAAGAGGTLTGYGAGRQIPDRFGGAIIIDDSIKPDEATSDVIRTGRNVWYKNTVESRVNNPTLTPIICIGQTTHEDDLIRNLANGFDGNVWNCTILPALNEHNQALAPNIHTVEQLLQMQEFKPYEFAAQYQQNPIPSGGALYKDTWWVILEKEPEIIATFIVCDTAETEATYNDATAMSFFGLYEIENNGIKTGKMGLHWLDCIEERVEPKDLQPLFMSFWSTCMQHRIKPKLVCIEKKSSGSTLLSLLSDMRGVEVHAIDNKITATNKSNRFIDAQSFVSQRLISLPKFGKHTDMVLAHMSKITANQTHRWDDIADTFAYAVRLGLIDKIISGFSNANQDLLVSQLAQQSAHQRNVRARLWKT